MRKRRLHIVVDGVRVTLQRRPDGGVRAYSPDMLGLVLSGKDWWAVLSDLSPAIKAIRGYLAVPAEEE